MYFKWNYNNCLKSQFMRYYYYNENVLLKYFIYYICTSIFPLFDNAIMFVEMFVEFIR